MERSSFPKVVKMIWFSCVMCLVLTGIGVAQEKYPAREISLITGLAPASATDLSLRALCSAAGKFLGQPIVVVNKPGGAHAIALSAIKNAKPDGYSLGTLSSGAMLSQLMRKVPYDFAKDFTFIMQYMDFQSGIVVRADAPWTTVQDLVAYAKSKPGAIRCGVLGVGQGHHITMERLALKTGAKFTMIPFGDSAGAVTNLLGKHVEAIHSPSTWLPNVEAGQLKILAVSGAGEKRMAQYPEVPTIMELYGIPLPGFTSIGGPKGLPTHVVNAVHQAFKKAMEDPDFVKTAEKFAAPIVYKGPEELNKYVMETFDDAAAMIKKLGLRKD